MAVINHNYLIANVVEEELFEGVPVELGIDTRDIGIVSSSNCLCHCELCIEHGLLGLGHRVDYCIDCMDTSTHLPVSSIIVELKVDNASFEAASHEMFSVVILVNCVCSKGELVEFVNVCRNSGVRSDLLDLCRLPFHIGS